MSLINNHNASILLAVALIRI